MDTQTHAKTRDWETLLCTIVSKMISSDFAVSLLSRLLHCSNDRITVISNYDHKEIRLRVRRPFSDMTDLPGQHSSPVEGAFLRLLWAIYVYIYSVLSKV